MPVHGTWDSCERHITPTGCGSVNGHNDRWDVDMRWWSVQMKRQDRSDVSLEALELCTCWKLFLSYLHESDVYQKVAACFLAVSAFSTSVDVCSVRGLCCVLSLQMSFFFFPPTAAAVTLGWKPAEVSPLTSCTCAWSNPCIYICRFQ